MRNTSVCGDGSSNVQLQTSSSTPPANDFDLLLSDDTALIDFMAFLRDEFSEENAIFWQKCEEYRKSTDAAYRKQFARLIYMDHVAESSVDQVNIDADVRQNVERRLSTAPANLFDDAQRQIYLLMKYDPYPRYVSTRRDPEDDVVGLLPPPFHQLGHDSDCGTEDAQKDERRRWSLLPNWLADRRRRSTTRDDVCVGNSTSTSRRHEADVTGHRESSSGLTRFIKRLSHGDRKSDLPPPPPPSSQRRNNTGTKKQPITTSNAKLRPPPPSGREINGTRGLACKRSTSIVGMNSVATQKSHAVARSTPQRAIRCR